MTITITSLAPCDVEALHSLACDIWRQHYPAIIGTAQTEYMLAQRYARSVVLGELAEARVWWDVLRERGRMVAFASSFPGEAAREMKLDKLYVRPDRQRRGYGGTLIAHTCARAKRLSYERVVLAVNRQNANAIAAYLKHGFRIREAVVKDIGCGFVMDDYIMERAVTLSAAAPESARA
ncbi:MAG: diamine N-acetyltransferase [Betaproteobacteria bacterium]